MCQVEFSLSDEQEYCRVICVHIRVFMLVSFFFFFLFCGGMRKNACISLVAESGRGLG